MSKDLTSKCEWRCLEVGVKINRRVKKLRLLIGLLTRREKSMLKKCSKQTRCKCQLR